MIASTLRSYSSKLLNFLWEYLLYNPFPNVEDRVLQILSSEIIHFVNYCWGLKIFRVVISYKSESTQLRWVALYFLMGLRSSQKVRVLSFPTPTSWWKWTNAGGRTRKKLPTTGGRSIFVCFCFFVCFFFCNFPMENYNFLWKFNYGLLWSP